MMIKSCLDQMIERFDRGMFISINNHKQGNDDLYGSLKKQYQSLIYALTGSNQVEIK